MKKLLYVAMLLALVVSAWAQVSAVVQTAGSLMEIRFAVRMTGLSVTLHAAGSMGTSTLVRGLWTTPFAALSTYTLQVSGTAMPCDVVHGAFWVENTGGITVDVYTYADYAQSVIGAADDAWILTANGAVFNNCSGLAEDQYKLGYAATFPTGAIGAFPSASADDLDGNETLITSLKAITALLAEDSETPVDGVWNADQIDQKNWEVILVVPPSAGIPVADGGSGALMDVHNIKQYLFAQVTP